MLMPSMPNKLSHSVISRSCPSAARAWRSPRFFGFVLMFMRMRPKPIAPEQTNTTRCPFCRSCDTASTMDDMMRILGSKVDSERIDDEPSLITTVLRLIPSFSIAQHTHTHAPAAALGTRSKKVVVRGSSGFGLNARRTTHVTHIHALPHFFCPSHPNACVPKKFLVLDDVLDSSECGTRLVYGPVIYSLASD